MILAGDLKLHVATDAGKHHAMFTIAPDASRCIKCHRTLNIIFQELQLNMTSGCTDREACAIDCHTCACLYCICLASGKLNVD